MPTGPTGLGLLAYAMGYAARERGETAIANPFSDSPEAARAWQDGWMTAAPAVRVVTAALTLSPLIAAA